MKKHVMLAVAILSFAVSPAVLAQLRLLRGEVILEPDGVYTHIYLYTHRETGKEVIMVGTLHHAENAYFARIQKILDSCKYVIFEMQDTRSELERIRGERESREKLFSSDLDTAFWHAFFSFPSRTSTKFLGLSHESVAFDYIKPNWVVGDALWYEEQKRTQWQLFYQKWHTLVAKVSPDIKQEIVAAVRAFVRRTDLGVVTKADMVSLTITLPYGIHDRTLTTFALEVVGRERDEATLRIFDQISSYNSGRICIKFGAGHMLQQRKLLEQRGYRLEHIRKYRAIALP